MKYLLCVLFLICQSSYALDARQLADPIQQENYETLTKELRCLVCQNQTIADSNADLAKDLREQIFEMLQQGKSKQDIIQFMTDRYGDFVLYKPPFNAVTGLLWLAPALFLIIGIIAVIIFIRSKKAAPTGIDEAKLAQARALLQQGKEL